MDRNRHLLNVPLLIIALILVVVALRQLQMLFMPLAVALFCVMLLRPLERRIHRRVPHRWVSIGAVGLTFIAVLAAFFAVVGWVFSRAAGHLPQFVDQLTSRWQDIQQWVRGHGVPVRDMFEGGDWSRVTDLIGRGLLTTQSIMTGLVLIFFLFILIMLEVDTWRDKIKTTADSARRKRRLLDSIDMATDRMRQYLLVLTLMNLLAAVLGGAWLWVIGVKLFYLWALLIFVLSYLPIIGSLVAAIPPILMALIQEGGGWTLALAAAGGLLATEQVIGNFLTPRIQGQVHHLSPLVALLALLFWSWVWGIVGAFLALPLTIFTLVLMAHFPGTRPLSLLMSDIADYETLIDHAVGQEVRDQEEREDKSGGGEES